MEYESYLAEAGFTVEKYEEGEYGWIYKVTGVIVVDDNLYSKVVPIDNFIKVYNDFKWGKYGNKLYIDTLEGERNTGFWDSRYTYYIAKLTELPKGGIDFSEYYENPSKDKSDMRIKISHVFSSNCYCIIGSRHEYCDMDRHWDGVKVSRVVHSVMLGKKQIVNPYIPAMLLDCDGFKVDLVYNNGKTKLLGDGFLNNGKSYNIILECEKRYNKLVCLFNQPMYDIDYNRCSRHTVSSDRFTTNGAFIDFCGLTGIPSNKKLPETLILPPKCEYLYLNNLEEYKGKINKIVINPDFKAFKIRRGSSTGLQINEIYFPRNFSTSINRICTILSSLLWYYETSKDYLDRLDKSIKHCEYVCIGKDIETVSYYVSTFVKMFFKYDMAVYFY